MSIVNQREIGLDTLSYANALRAALREDPDVILVGEMRDFETISVAITAAETGHLVLSTLHTIGAASTVDRVIDVFPPHQQQQIRIQLANVLEAEGINVDELVENDVVDELLASATSYLNTAKTYNGQAGELIYSVQYLLVNNPEETVHNTYYTLSKKIDVETYVGVIYTKDNEGAITIVSAGDISAEIVKK